MRGRRALWTLLALAIVACASRGPEQASTCDRIERFDDPGDVVVCPDGAIDCRDPIVRGERLAWRAVLYGHYPRLRDGRSEMVCTPAFAALIGRPLSIAGFRAAVPDHMRVSGGAAREVAVAMAAPKDLWLRRHMPRDSLEVTRARTAPDGDGRVRFSGRLTFTADSRDPDRNSQLPSIELVQD